MTTIQNLEIGGNPLDSIPSEIHAHEQTPFKETLRYMKMIRNSRRAFKVDLQDFGFSKLPSQV
eukprot:CAMPEP_0179481364 /NCGR_PEP_ID=MMETSP0799-20121207/59125_1 /TAXON_ID=46947 /ORGANISM="Geminigera cryophila, Strain CCMP2564" /LENGTH=62 /DNA_ID=CAMNT_0021293963 /DNA_START=13 /DNA_END=198 /DNA_ORIENTATION=+